MTKVGFFYYTKRLGGSLLDEYYGKEENIFVKTRTIVLVSQTASGDNADYLVRVEWLGHDAGFGDANALFALVINCLRDTIYEWNWEWYLNLVETSSVARHAVDVLASNCDGGTLIKKRWVQYIILLRVAHTKLVIVVNLWHVSKLFKYLDY